MENAGRGLETEPVYCNVEVVVVMMVVVMVEVLEQWWGGRMEEWREIV